MSQILTSGSREKKNHILEQIILGKKLQNSSNGLKENNWEIYQEIMGEKMLILSKDYRNKQGISKSIVKKY